MEDKDPKESETYPTISMIMSEESKEAWIKIPRILDELQLIKPVTC